MKYYFVGIKGTGMASLALIIKDLGNEVIGADITKTLFTEKELIAKDIVIESLEDMHYHDSDIIVVGNAFIDKYHFENKEVMTYQELLSFISDKYYSIAVCGTHGKTTITNMIKHVLSAIDNVSYLVGDGTGKAYKDSKYFVFEACEHRDHFLSYFPDMIVCDNVEYDHVEYFINKRQYKKSFKTFFNRAQSELILNNKVKYKGEKYTYGSKNANIIVKKCVFTDKGVTFDLKVENNFYQNLYLPFYGKHMLNDALCCITCCYKLNMDIPVIIEKLKTYKFAKRRYNTQEISSNVLIDDYGHHPSEIKATIMAIKQQYPCKDLIIFYHPDRPKRLIAFLYKYQAAFNKSKVTYVLPFLNNGKDETNALLSIIDNKKIKLFCNDALEIKYENTVFLLTGSKEMINIKDKLTMLYK